MSLPDDFSFGEFVCFLDARTVSVEEANQIRDAKPEGFPIKVVRVVPEGAPKEDRHTAEDLDGRYLAAFDELGVIAICYRPDYHGFGSAKTVAEAAQLVASVAG